MKYLFSCVLGEPTWEDFLLLLEDGWSHMYLGFNEEYSFLLPHILLFVAERLRWRAAGCWPTVFHFSFVAGGHRRVRLIVADLCCFFPSLTDRCENSLASAGVTVVVKENHESIQLTWGNRTASCGQRCCRTSGRTRSSPTTSCRSGTRYGGWIFFQGVPCHSNGATVFQ